MNGIELRNVRDLWMNNMRNFPRKPAVIWQGREYTFEQLDDLTNRVCAGLQHRLGMNPEDRIAIAAPNCLEF
ncbi:MAG TPA: long-chain fatty acid--CoA ligase, partial [Armatimonadetes bacterium]|nr:long-chain fatty acid--CoA ligase [Armatimonadota bacterium]